MNILLNLIKIYLSYLLYITIHNNIDQWKLNMHKYNIQSMTIELYFQQNKRVAPYPVEADYI